MGNKALAEELGTLRGHHSPSQRLANRGHQFNIVREHKQRESLCQNTPFERERTK